MKSENKKKESEPEKKMEEKITASPDEEGDKPATTVANQQNKLSLKKSEVKLTVEEKNHGPVTLKDWKEFFGFSLGIPGMTLYSIISLICSII